MANKPTEEWIRTEINENLKKCKETFVTEEEKEEMVELLLDSLWENFNPEVWRLIVIDGMTEVVPELEDEFSN